MDHIEPGCFEITSQDEFRKMKSAGSAFSDGDVLYGRLRPYLNKVHKARFEGVASAEFIVLPKAATHDSDFLKYLLHQLAFVQFANEHSSGDRPRVKFDAISGFQFSLPPIAEQRRIVDRIDELLSRIEAGERAVETASAALKRYRKTVLTAAVTGALTKDWREAHPPEEAAEDLLARILKERRAAWEAAELDKLKAKGKPSPSTDKQWAKFRERYTEPVLPVPEGLPELPRGWVWATVDQLSSFITSGSRGWSEYYSDGGAIFIRAQNINTEKLSLHDVAYVSLPNKAEGTRTLIEQFDILITITGANVTKTALVERKLGEAYVNQHVALLRLTSHQLSRYVTMFLQSKSGGGKQLEEAAYGAGKPGLNLTNIAEVSVALPPAKEQIEIISRVEEALSRADAAEATLDAQARAASALKQSILKAAFTGRLVPQDSNDEPASKLLKRVRQERS